MKEIILECGSKVLVDVEDYDYITLFYDLHLDEYGYVQCRIKEKFRRKKMGLYSNISLHKLLVLPDKTGRSTNVDHEEGNKLDNRKSRLRICTHEENMRNRKHQKSTSQYKGVHWDIRLNKWRAQINYEGKRILIGAFTNEIAAANGYNYYAQKLYGEFARTNDAPLLKEDEWRKDCSKDTKTSKYRGVCFSDGKYVAQIWDGKRNIVAGRFDSEIEAAEAYNKKAIEIKGDKAKLNDIEVK